MQAILFILIISILVFLIIRKVNLQYVFLLGSFLFIILFKLSILPFFNVFLTTIGNTKTWQLIGAVLLMLLFNDVLRKTERLQLLISSLRELIKSVKLIASFIPALVGLLPMLGGAMISAPMVKEALDNCNVSKEKKTLINYWYRHVWEYILPLYPGVILASGLLNINLSKLILYQVPLTLTAIISGFLYLFDLREKKPKIFSKKSKNVSILNILIGLLPILIVIAGVAIFKINIIIVLVIVIISLLIIFKEYIPKIYKDFDYKKYVSMFAMVFGLMLFKDSFIKSGAVNILPDYLISTNVPSFVIVSLIPLSAGLMTGVTHAEIGISFPIIMPFLVTENGINMGCVVLAYASGFAGVLLSPVHVCLAITKDYFKADSKKLYRLLIPAVAALLAYAFVLYFLYQ